MGICSSKESTAGHTPYYIDDSTRPIAISRANLEQIPSAEGEKKTPIRINIKTSPNNTILTNVTDTPVIISKQVILPTQDDPVSKILHSLQSDSKPVVDTSLNTITNTITIIELLKQNK